jgi:hypothetical protein
MTTQPQPPTCDHVKYYMTKHCAIPSCVNYIEKCPGTPKNTLHHDWELCTHNVTPTTQLRHAAEAPSIRVQVTLTFENTTLTQLQRAVHMIDAAEWEDNPLEAQRNAIDPNNVRPQHVMRAWAIGTLQPEKVEGNWNPSPRHRQTADDHWGNTNIERLEDE